MAEDICRNCGNQYKWNWEGAFDKFGFNDGDGQIETESVVSILEQAGYHVESHSCGLHNTIIGSIIKDYKEVMPVDDNSISIGYCSARDYLPLEIIRLLDKELGD